GCVDPLHCGARVRAGGAAFLEQFLKIKVSSAEADLISPFTGARHFVPGFPISPLRGWRTSYSSGRGHVEFRNTSRSRGIAIRILGDWRGAARRRPHSRRGRWRYLRSDSFQDGGEEAVAGVDAGDGAEVRALRQRWGIGPGQDSCRSQAIEFSAAV